MTEPFVKHLRENMTHAEVILWQHLRRKQMHGLRFRRQYPLGRYVADFVCLPARLIVELDGGQHALPTAAERTRTRWLEDQGFRVLRFWNNEVIGNIDGVISVIAQALAGAAAPTPPPAPPARGGDDSA